jgi:hypothetical protein
MKRSNHQTVLLGLLAMTVCCGCQTFGEATIRGQSPPPMNYPSSNARQLYHTPIRSAAAEIQDIAHEHHNTDTYYFSGAQPAGHHHHVYGDANCPPEGYGYCPPGYGRCPHGHAHHLCRTGLCQDKFSYGYQVPNDLVYPPAGAIGGAVVYPYYTLRGPSDFFRQ